MPRSAKTTSRSNQPLSIRDGQSVRKFVRTWQTSPSRAVVAVKMRISTNRAKNMAASLRRRGVKLKPMKRDEIDWNEIKRLAQRCANK